MEVKKAPLLLSEVLKKKEGLKETGKAGVDQHQPFNVKLQQDIKEETQRLMQLYDECSGNLQTIYEKIDPKYGVKLELLTKNAPKTASEFAWQCQEGSYHKEGESLLNKTLG